MGDPDNSTQRHARGQNAPDFSQPQQQQGSKRQRYQHHNGHVCSNYNNNRRRNNNNSNSWEARGGKSRRRQHVPFQNKTAPPEVSKCSVCQVTENPKYKCPTCRAAYCCVACCRKHKETPCQKETQQTTCPKLSEEEQTTSKYLPASLLKKNLQQDDATATTTSGFVTINQRDQNNYEDLEDGWKMTQDMINSMHQSEWLQKELQDAGLQQIISEVASASHAVVGGGGGGRKFKHQHHQPQQQRIDEATTHQERLLHKLQGDHHRFKHFLDKLLVLTGVLEGGQEEVGEGEKEHMLMNEGTPQQLVLKPLPSRFVIPTSASQNIKNKTDNDAHGQQGGGDGNNDEDSSCSDSDESSSSSSSSTSSSSSNNDSTDT